MAQDTRKTLAVIQRTSTDVSKAVGGISAKGGALDQMAEAVGQVSAAADNFSRGTLPNLGRTMSDVGQSARRLGDTADSFRQNPQSLLYGSPDTQPGPGEQGFVAPAAAGAR